MRGFFGVGAENVSRLVNAGNLFRSAHAFGAGFVFTIGATSATRALAGDTSRTGDRLPWYSFGSVRELRLPDDCRLVGVELVGDAIPLPVFPHPLRAAYVFGPERGSLSPELLARCDSVVRIPTRFCINLVVAASIVMYDRLAATRSFGERPLFSRARSGPPASHVHGLPLRRTGGKGAREAEDP